MRIQIEKTKTGRIINHYYCDCGRKLNKDEATSLRAKCLRCRIKDTKKMYLN